MLKRTFLKIVCACLVLSGCITAPQKPIPMSDEKLTRKPARIGVAMAPMPEVNTWFPGANCLLCLAFAEGSNSQLSKHTQTLGHDTLPKLGNDIASLLRKRGLDAIAIDEPILLDKLEKYTGTAPDTAGKDYTQYKNKYEIDKLVVIQLHSIGFSRAYSSYIPVSDPKASIHGTGYMVNLSNNSYEWYMPISVQKSADGQWDEPPSYPGLSNAYYQAIEISRASVLRYFGN